MQSTKLILIGVLIFGLFSCQEEVATNASVEYKKEIDDWHNKRISNLKKETGWLNLIGLHWLKEGENTFGSDVSNDIQFLSDSAPSFVGKIIKKDSVIIAIINENINVTLKEKPIHETVMKHDISGEPTILSLDSLRWFIIKRGKQYGVRLRDLESKLLKEFEGIERFPTNEDWKVNATFERYNIPPKISVPTVLGTVEEEETPGIIRFSLGENEFSLSPVTAGERLFLVFADLTSGEETYGGGRFLYVDSPDSNSNVVLDFNKAYNPPCAFTKYATCPLPPEENKLRIRITAGEKNYGKGH